MSRRNTPNGSEPEEEILAAGSQTETEEDAAFQALSKERDDLADAVLRLKAEFSNYRSRSEKERSEKDVLAEATLTVKILPVLDAFDAGMEYDAESLKPIYAVMLSVLTEAGLELVSPQVGEIFDPQIHEALVDTAPSPDNPEDNGENQNSGDVVVTDVVRLGYRWKDKLLRPAQVRVT